MATGCDSPAAITRGHIGRGYGTVTASAGLEGAEAVAAILAIQPSPPAIIEHATEGLVRPCGDQWGAAAPAPDRSASTRQRGDGVSAGRHNALVPSSPAIAPPA